MIIYNDELVRSRIYKGRSKLHVFFVLSFTVEQLFNFRVEGCESFLLLSVREVDRLVSSRRDDVKFGVKDVNSMNNSVQTGESERRVRLILSNGVLAETLKKHNITTLAKILVPKNLRIA